MKLGFTPLRYGASVTGSTMKQRQLDLWLRMAALKKCCDVRLDSYLTGATGSEVERWRATITRRSDAAAAPIIADGATAAEALVQALDRSLTQKWHTEE